MARPKKNVEPRDASLRVSRRMRDKLKAAAAVMGRPLYEVTNEAINNYLDNMHLTDQLDRWRGNNKEEASETPKSKTA